MACSKIRLRFRKDGDLRLISHHDLLRTFERMLRRAAIPFHSTQGFNPKPRLVFALSLALGIIGHEEVVELELDEDDSASLDGDCSTRESVLLAQQVEQLKLQLEDAESCCRRRG